MRRFTVVVAMMAGTSLAEDCVTDGTDGRESHALLQGVPFRAAIAPVEQEAAAPKWPSVMELLFSPGLHFDEVVTDKSHRRASLAALEQHIETFTGDKCSGSGQCSGIVKEFAASALEVVETSVIARIADEHRIQQESLNSVYAQFAQVESMRAQDAAEVLRMAKAVDAARGHHSECRQRESTACLSLQRCKAKLKDLDADELAQRRQASFIDRSRSMTAQVEPEGDSAVTSEVHNSKTKMCNTLQLYQTHNKTKCALAQDSFERVACGQRRRVENAISDYESRMSLVISAYNALKSVGKEEEVARKAEQKSLVRIAKRLRAMSGDSSFEKNMSLDIHFEDTPSIGQLPEVPLEPGTAAFAAQEYGSMPECTQNQESLKCI